MKRNHFEKINEFMKEKYPEYTHMRVISRISPEHKNEAIFMRFIVEDENHYIGARVIGKSSKLSRPIMSWCTCPAYVIIPIKSENMIDMFQVFDTINNRPAGKNCTFYFKDSAEEHLEFMNMQLYGSSILM